MPGAPLLETWQAIPLTLKLCNVSYLEADEAPPTLKLQGPTLSLLGPGISAQPKVIPESAPSISFQPKDIPERGLCLTSLT